MSIQKSKEKQANPNKKAWISLDSFGGIGAFQRVTANPNKKTPTHLCLRQIFLKCIPQTDTELSQSLVALDPANG
jgi:hypothetical protein